MSIIQEIKDRLKKYKNIEISEEENLISVFPSDGFEVWLSDNNASYTVGFEGWHEEFDEKDEALNCFVWGLSSECRLSITSRGGKAHKWVVQRKDTGKWVNDSTTGLLWFKFWLTPKIEFKQNNVLHI